MRQRAGLAQTLINDPDLVILDEPMSGLDPIGRKDVRDLILSLRDEGKTVFFASHILEDAEVICDQVAIILNGRIVTQGYLDQLLGQEMVGAELVVEAIGHVWPDPFVVAPPCCPRISFDEALLAAMVSAAAQRDRPQFDLLTAEMLGGDAREMIFAALENFIRAQKPERI